MINENFSNNNKNTEPETEEKKYKNCLSDTSVIKLLTGIIVILITYILGMQIIDYYKANTDSFAVEYNTLTETTTQVTEFTVNINTDNVLELTQLDGIGTSKANAIIEYRKENGNFISIEELKNVSGIGEVLFEKIKNYITIE